MEVRGGKNIQSRDYMCIQSFQLGHGKLGICSKYCNEVVFKCANGMFIAFALSRVQNCHSFSQYNATLKPPSMFERLGIILCLHSALVWEQLLWVQKYLWFWCWDIPVNFSLFRLFHHCFCLQSMCDLHFFYDCN